MKRIISPILAIIVIFAGSVPALSQQNPRGEEFVIASGKTNQFNPTI